MCLVDPKPDTELTEDEKKAVAADRFHLVTPFVNAINKNWAAALAPSRKIALDESMIKFRGTHKSMQHLPRKPIRVGFKAFSTATTAGYTLEQQLYAGKNGASGVGLTERIVRDLLRPYTDRYHVVAMDSYYTNPKLFEELAGDKLLAVGSIVATRKWFPADLATAKPANDTFQSRQLVQTPSVVAIVHANYKRTKHYLSTATAVAGGAIATVDRALGKKTKAKPKLAPGAVRAPPRLHPTPSPVMLYNEVMGGVDVANNLAARNTLWRMSKDWWRSIFLHYVNVSIVNAWYLYRWYGADDLKWLTPRQFRTRLASELTREYVGRAATGRPPKRPRGGAVHRQIETDKKESNGNRSSRFPCSVCFQREGPRGLQKQIGFKSKWVCSHCNVYVCDARVHPACWRKHCELGVESVL